MDLVSPEMSMTVAMQRAMTMAMKEEKNWHLRGQIKRMSMHFIF